MNARRREFVLARSSWHAAPGSEGGRGREEPHVYPRRVLMITAASAQRTLARALPPWWLMLITGLGWILVGLIVLRFDYSSVSAISILFGIVAIAAGIVEIGVLILAAGWWKLLHAIAAVVFIAAGIVAF